MSDEKDEKSLQDEELDKVSGGRFPEGGGHSRDAHGIGPDEGRRKEHGINPAESM
jgi:hypothetical protein